MNKTSGLDGECHNCFYRQTAWICNNLQSQHFQQHVAPDGTCDRFEPSAAQQHLHKAFSNNLALLINSSAKRFAKSVFRSAVPLSLRKQLAIFLGRHKIRDHYYYTLELLRDFAEKDTNEFHRFLWANHLAYAETYEIDQRFGESKLQTTRKILIADLNSFLQQRGINPATDIHSIFDVGCSLGYLLRFLETDICQSASVVRGLDIDRYAIETGTKYLRSIGSKVELFAADMTDAETIMGPGKYDLVFCCGVLNYLDEPTAAAVVRVMLQHTGRFLVIKDRANPEQDNRLLTHSIPRPEGDGSMVHNLDRMLVEAGGDVVFRRWEGAQVYESQTVYNLVAEPRNLTQKAFKVSRKASQARAQAV